MHRRILKDANFEQLASFIDRAIIKVKNENKDLYDELELCLYKEVYGCHFNSWLLEKALSEMINEDGTKGGHWTIDDTTSVARSVGVEFKNFNEYDWCYVMNMVYSDYYGVINNDAGSYAKIAKRFLEDKDAKVGKAFYYYLMK